MYTFVVLFDCFPEESAPVCDMPVNRIANC